MKRKNIFTLWLTTALCLSFLVTSVWAGPKQHHRWQGVGIGVGVAMLGTALWNAYQEPRPARPPLAVVVPEYDSRPYARRWERGHWEIRKEWMPPTYKRIWNPGHYDRRGRWVSETWIEVVHQPGYWREARVWVARR